MNERGMTTPRTAAGRDMVSDPRFAEVAEHPHPDYIVNCWLCEHIAAIEAEARAAALDAACDEIGDHIPQGGEDQVGYGQVWCSCGWMSDSGIRAAIDALRERSGEK